MKENKEIKNYKNHSTVSKVDFTVIESSNGIECDMQTLKLRKYLHTSNMVLFDSTGKLHKYDSVDEIIDEFCRIRYDYYFKRKEYIVNNLKYKIKILQNKKRFIQEIRDGKLQLFKKSRSGKRESKPLVELISDLADGKIR